MSIIGTLLYCLTAAPGLWLADLAAGELLNIARALLVLLVVHMLWSVYKIHGLLGRRPLKPVEANQAVLITGATSGIGLALAKHLFGIGYSVIATYYDSREPGHAELLELQRKQSPAGNAKKLILHQLDVTNETQIQQVYEKVADELNKLNFHLHALINNAGLGSLQPFNLVPRKLIKGLLNTNISGSLMMTREFLPLLAKPRAGRRAGSKPDNGRLVFVSSGLAFVTGPTFATYGVTKNALVYFAKVMNLELRQRYGIKSVAVIPHNFIKNTNITTQNTQQTQQAWDEMKPLERELYAAQHEEQLRLARSLEEATREHQKLVVAESQPKRGYFDLPAKRRRDVTIGHTLKGLFKTSWSFVSDILNCMQGQNTSSTLEESGALECFEQALRLEDPPEHIFAGDKIWQFYMGVMLISMPQCLSSLFASTITPSLYK